MSSFVFVLLLLLGFFGPKFPYTNPSPLIMDDSFLDCVIAINSILFFLWFLTGLLLAAIVFFFLKNMLIWFRGSSVNFREFLSSIFLILSLFVCVAYVFPIVIYVNTLDLLLFCFADSVKLDTIPSGVSSNNFLSCLNIQITKVIELPVACAHIGDAPAAFVFRGDEGFACTQYGKFFSNKLDDGTLIGKIKVFVASNSLKLGGYKLEYICIRVSPELLKSFVNCESCKKC